MEKNNRLKMLDMFSGMGGMSIGFARRGFSVTGIDIEPFAVDSYNKLTGGTGSAADLREITIKSNYDVIAGGPPCRPWSTVNLKARKMHHRDYDLVQKYFSIVTDKMPRVFIMENVPAIMNDPVIGESINNAVKMGYTVKTGIIRYSDYGAATARQRFFVTGVKGEKNNIFEYLAKQIKITKTVRDAIWPYRHLNEGATPDHVWPHLRTISKYSDKYRTGKYGWRWLKWDEPSPSFGNVMKTYTLHPNYPPENPNARVISVLEALRIMGFDNFEFPKYIPMGKRYQMVVDSISPVFSYTLAGVIKDVLREARTVTA
ncbi:MAG: DNA cytosine methyltransferase [Ferroplasma sp.]|uniref:DNA cytosine methyltransferase n=1 Tax=Ferroplasma sp. TaxID=2591003 RepID=UPI0028168A69|nr:DNA cytosine methyltransferase [Ferroplasma sp.]WMT50546.1 MAG: DNA cytosine methyltransferase [Ferroplasma sp.]